MYAPTRPKKQAGRDPMKRLHWTAVASVRRAIALPRIFRRNRAKTAAVVNQVPPAKPLVRSPAGLRIPRRPNFRGLVIKNLFGPMVFCSSSPCGYGSNQAIFEGCAMMRLTLRCFRCFDACWLFIEQHRRLSGGHGKNGATGASPMLHALAFVRPEQKGRRRLADFGVFVLSKPLDRLAELKPLAQLGRPFGCCHGLFHVLASPWPERNVVRGWNR